jgi:SsrA-binding protein
MAKRVGEKLIAENRKARHDYHLSDFLEAGLMLHGTEVKSCRDGRANLRQAYAEIRDGEAWLVGAHISVYEQGNINNHEPERARKLLLHRKQVDDLYAKVREKGMTIVPTRMYFKDGRAKVEIALARGKDLHDKRADVVKRDADREIQRALKEARR